MQPAGQAAKKKRATKQNSMDAFNARARGAVLALADERESAGLYPCRHINERTVMCRGVYSTATGLAKHAAAVDCGEAPHKCGSANARNTIVALSQQPGGVLALGARPDRDATTAAAAAPVPSAAPCAKASVLGQYAKPARAKPHYMTDTQLDYLEGLFNEGEEDSSQRTSPEAAHEYMRAARCDPGNLLLYGRGKAAGALPGAEKIKAWFSAEKRRKAKGKGRFSATWKGRRVMEFPLTIVRQLRY